MTVAVGPARRAAASEPTHPGAKGKGMSITIIKERPPTATPPANSPAETGPVRPPPPPPLAFIQRNPLLSFYFLAFAISWSGILAIIGGPANFPGTSQQIEKLFFSVMLAWLAGPSIASIVMTGLVSGRTGYRELL